MNNEEVWKPIIRKRKVIPNYYISNRGRVFSHKTGKFLKVRNKTHYGRGNASDILLVVPKGWSNYNYYRNRISCQIHQLVAEAFFPIESNPPEKLKNTWDQIITEDMVGQKRIPDEWKIWVADTVIIDHIDDDPFNNSVENLRYVTPEENNSHKKRAFNETNNT